ncbi:MAG: putative lipid II flippase FtsW [Clostridiaceae bacterium]|jgi:cell division protein FtsW|nr:putative lipid II flippase FtsW [Clostridiaceae bacterium]
MKRRDFDFWIFITVLLLLSLGVCMVYSASSYYAGREFGNKEYFLVRQLLWATIGVIAMLIVSRLDYKRLAQFSPILLLISIILLVLVRIPGIGSYRNGAYRWFDFGFASFQPSEMAKLSIILFFSFTLSKKTNVLQSFFKGLFPYLLVIGVIDVLLIMQPHYSGTILVTAVAIIILFCAGAKIWHFILLAIPVIPAGIYLILTEEYRLERLMTFLDPFSDPTDSGYQIVNSLYAIGSGGLFGKGIGQSVQKNLYIPEPHTDFIFSILAEELGFIGAVTVLLLFLVLIWRGIRVAMHSQDNLGSLLAVGITSLIAVQVIINIAVVTASLPVTGMPLPFFTSGGSSLAFLLVGIGILLNVSRSAGNQYRMKREKI